MSVAEGLIVVLPDTPEADVEWLRVVSGAVTQTGRGTGWLHATGLSELPASAEVMLVPPASLTVLHWIDLPDLPPLQGRAAARLSALEGSLALSDSLFAAADRNDDPAEPHVVAVAARSDMAQWLLWAQHHGLDPDLVVPAALLLPGSVEDGLNRALLGGQSIVRGPRLGMADDAALAEVLAGETLGEVGKAAVQSALVAGLDDAPLNMRQGDFERRIHRPLDKALLQRLAMLVGFILLASLIMSVATLIKYDRAAATLDSDSLERAQRHAPAAQSAGEAVALLTAKLAARGDASFGFGGRLAAIYAAMQGVPDVTLNRLSQNADGSLALALSAPNIEAANKVLVALQQSGFNVTQPSVRTEGGRTLAEFQVLPS